MKFNTLSGSVYELDQNQKRIRRVSGNNRPTERQGDDWRSYSCIFPEAVEVGKSLMIFWIKEETPVLEGSPDFAIPATQTSVVMGIEN